MGGNSPEEKMSETKPQYTANYRNPPIHTRFKKGQSGNPRCAVYPRSEGRRTSPGATALRF